MVSDHEIVSMILITNADVEDVALVLLRELNLLSLNTI